MKQVSAVLIGAGLRGAHVYAAYALEHPDELRIVAVAESDVRRREAFAQKHQLAPDQQFTSWEDLLAKDKMADCALICTQDHMHFAPVLAEMLS